jgi:hypothetical protein
MREVTDELRCDVLPSDAATYQLETVNGTVYRLNTKTGQVCEIVEKVQFGSGGTALVVTKCS